MPVRHKNRAIHNHNWAGKKQTINANPQTLINKKEQVNKINKVKSHK